MNAARVLKRGEAAMAEIASAIGDDAAAALARAFGGTELYVPRTIGDHHVACVAIGRAAADRLAAWAGGTALAIPKEAERRARVMKLRDQGELTVAQIAVQTSLSERHVYRLLGESRDQAPLPLFDGIE